MNIHPIINSPRVPASIFGVAMLGTFTVSASAGTQKPKEEAYRKAYDVIQSVNATAHTVTVATMVKYVDENAQALAKAKVTPKKANEPAKVEKTVTLLVTKFTDVSVNGKPSDFSGLQKGMKVDVTKATTETEAARVVATQ